MAKICPLVFVGKAMPGKFWGSAIPKDCIEDKCAWWTGKECSIMSIGKRLSATT